MRVRKCERVHTHVRVFGYLFRFLVFLPHMYYFIWCIIIYFKRYACTQMLTYLPPPPYSHFLLIPIPLFRFSHFRLTWFLLSLFPHFLLTHPFLLPLFSFSPLLPFAPIFPPLLFTFHTHSFFSLPPSSFSRPFTHVLHLPLFLRTTVCWRREKELAPSTCPLDRLASLRRSTQNR